MAKKKKKSVRAKTKKPKAKKVVAQTLKTTKKKVAKGKKRPALTAQHREVLDLYLIDFKGASAWQKVFTKCSKDSAYVLAGRLLGKPAAQAYLTKQIRKRRDKIGASPEEAMIECRRIALADVGEAFNEDGTLKNIHDIPKDLRRAIAGLEVIETFKVRGEKKVWTGYIKKVKFWNKDKEIETLFKHHGLFEADNDQSKQQTIIIVDFGKINDPAKTISE